MPPRYKVGDHVILKSEAGAVSGWVTKVHTQDFVHEGQWCHASEDEPQYEIESDSTDADATRRDGALKKRD